MRQVEGATAADVLAAGAAILAVSAIIGPIIYLRHLNKAAGQNLTQLRELGKSVLLYSEDYDQNLMNWSDWAFARSNGLPEVKGGLDAPGTMWDDKIRPYLAKAPTPEEGRFGGVLHSPCAEEGPSQRSYGINQLLVFEYLPTSTGSFHSGRHRWRTFNLAQAGQLESTLLLGDGGREGRLAPPRNWDGWTDKYQTKLGHYRREAPWRRNEGAAYVFLDGRAEWVRGDVLYKGGNFFRNRNLLFGQNHCDTAQWFLPTGPERVWHCKIAKDYGVTCW